MRCALGALLACVGSTATAQASEIEAGLTHETLTRGLAPWESRYVEAVHTTRSGHTLYGTLRETERFGQRDSEAGAGTYLVTHRSWTAQLEALYSPQHRVLPETSVFAGLSRTLGGGWAAGAGLRRNDYATRGARVLSLGIERYFGDWRASYTLYSGRPDGAGSAAAHRFQIDNYYGEHSRVGASFVTGREVENTGPVGGILTSDVTGIEVLAVHWLSSVWALNGAALMHRQGDLYERRGIRLGLRYRF